MYIFHSQELKQYLLELAKQPDSLFGRTVTQFVACTRWVFSSELSFLSCREAGGSETQMICVSRESSVTEPCVVMRNMRQVMNGLKNYTGELPMKFLHFTIFTFHHFTIFTFLPILCNRSEQRGR